ncbi:hypothetical protein ACGP04_03960 [Piscirickettsia salmonis]
MLSTPWLAAAVNDFVSRSQGEAGLLLFYDRTEHVQPMGAEASATR